MIQQSKSKLEQLARMRAANDSARKKINQDVLIGILLVTGGWPLLIVVAGLIGYFA